MIRHPCAPLVWREGWKAEATLTPQHPALRPDIKGIWFARTHLEPA